MDCTFDEEYEELLRRALTQCKRPTKVKEEKMMRFGRKKTFYLNLQTVCNSIS